jgi:tRNA pseudouridine38-40 synthase
MRIALKFAYDGKRFSGYARQPAQRTVEHTILDLLSTSEILADPRSGCFRTASRTDRGVSALGNVCSFDSVLSKDEVFSRLPAIESEIFIYGIQKVPSDFYPRHAKSRWYRYYLRNVGLDVEKVQSAAKVFIGEHNFQNFARVEPLKNPIRTINTIVITEKNDFFLLDFSAQTFLWNQIRRMVSAIQKVGTGTLTIDEIRDALEHPMKRVDFQVVAPEPLILTDVVYDFLFEHVPQYKKQLQDFEKRIIDFF